MYEPKVGTVIPASPEWLVLAFCSRTADPPSEPNISASVESVAYRLSLMIRPCVTYSETGQRAGRAMHPAECWQVTHRESSTENTVVAGERLMRSWFLPSVLRAETASLLRPSARGHSLAVKRLC